MEGLNNFGEAIGNLFVWIGSYELGFLHTIAVVMVALGLYTTIDNKTPESPRYCVRISSSIHLHKLLTTVVAELWVVVVLWWRWRWW